MVEMLVRIPPRPHYKLGCTLNIRNSQNSKTENPSAHMHPEKSDTQLQAEHENTLSCHYYVDLSCLYYVYAYMPKGHNKKYFIKKTLKLTYFIFN